MCHVIVIFKVISTITQDTERTRGVRPHKTSDQIDTEFDIYYLSNLVFVFVNVYHNDICLKSTK